MRTLLILFFLFYFYLNAYPQVISTSPQEINVGPISFNSTIIKNNKIKKMDIIMVDKPDGKVIVDKGAGQGYEFDAEGRISKYYYTVLIKTELEEIDVPEIKRKGKIIRPATTKTVMKYINDTVSATILYDKENRIGCKRLKSGDFYNAYYYEYDSKGRIIKELHCKETNISEHPKHFKLGVQTTLSSETFEYTEFSTTQVKKRCLNDEGREYKNCILNYDKNGNLISETVNYIVSWMRQETIYDYDAQNRLISKNYSGNVNGNEKAETIYEYDSKGLVLSEKWFLNNELRNEISYLFDENNILVKSHLNRDHKNASIGIVKYAYSFY
ncbi:MAG: hypothetical protein JNL69_12370 [Bacteroidia bacterium]|nr:hypothetical protein [Bacteroidia bacterium]